MEVRTEEIAGADLFRDHANDLETEVLWLTRSSAASQDLLEPVSKPSNKNCQLDQEEPNDPKTILSLPPEILLGIFDRTWRPMHLCDRDCFPTDSATSIAHYCRCQLLPPAGVCRTLDHAVDDWYRRQKLEIDTKIISQESRAILMTPHNKRWLRNVKRISVDLAMSLVTDPLASNPMRQNIRQLCNLLDMRPNEDWNDMRINFNLPKVWHKDIGVPVPNQLHKLLHVGLLPTQLYLPTDLYKLYFGEAFQPLIYLARTRLGQVKKGRKDKELSENGIGHELHVSDKPIWPSDMRNSTIEVLFVACAIRKREIAELMVQGYQDPPDVVEQHYSMALWIAVHRGHYEIAHILLDTGKIEGYMKQQGRRLTMAAIKNGDYRTVYVIHAHQHPLSRRQRKELLRRIDYWVSGEKDVATGKK